MAWLRGLLGRLLKAPPPDGIVLDFARCQQVKGVRDHAKFFRSLPTLVGPTAVLYLEGGNHPASLEAFLKAHALSAVARVARGTIWPEPAIVHLPVAADLMTQLAAITEKCAAPEVCWHVIVYENDVVLLSGYDAFTDPFFVSDKIEEPALAAFCLELGVKPEPFECPPR